MVNNKLKYFGSILLCLSVAGLGYIMKNDALNRTDFKTKFDALLKSREIVLTDKHLDKAFNILTSLVMFSGLAFLP